MVITWRDEFVGHFVVSKSVGSRLHSAPLSLPSVSGVGGFQLLHDIGLNSGDAPPVETRDKDTAAP